MLTTSLAIVLIVAGIACIATSCSQGLRGTARIDYLTAGIVLVVLSVGVAGFELLRGVA